LTVYIKAATSENENIVKTLGKIQLVPRGFAFYGGLAQAILTVEGGGG
jgi:hypothetical protein